MGLLHKKMANKNEAKTWHSPEMWVLGFLGCPRSNILLLWYGGLKLRIHDIAGDDSRTEEFGKGYYGTHRTVWFQSEEKTERRWRDVD